MPRACLKCGHENPDDVDFCEQCGEYVRWELSGVRQAVPAPPPPPPVPAAARETPVVAPPEAPQPVEAAAAPPPEVAPPDAADGSAYEPAPASAGTSAYATPRQTPEPDSVVVTLRLPEDESATGGEVTPRVEAGATTNLIALVRNQSGIVDNYDLHVEGLPEGWWTISPATVYLVPYGAPGGEYEQEVMVSLHPPRAAEAEARTWPIRVVAVSKANGVAAGQATAALAITPYHELEAEMRPERAVARRRAQYAIAVRNRANAPVDVQLAGVDPDNEMRFSFQKPRFTVAPGRRNGSAFMVLPPKPALVGRSVQRRFEITSTVIGSETGALPKAATLVQKPWIPAWALLLVPLLLIAAIAGYLLWPRTATVPELTGKKLFAAQQLLDEAGLTLGNQTEKQTDEAAPGTIVNQSPGPGEEVDKSSAVALEIAVATGFGNVPNVVGKTLADAERILSAQQFTFAAQSQPQDPAKDKIATQIPEADELADKATPVQIFFAVAEPGGTSTAVEDGRPGGGGTPTTGKPVVKPGEIALPAVTGLAPAAAVAALTDKKINATIEQEYNAEFAAGQLIRQVPQEGTKVGEGSTVLLVYSKGYPRLLFDQDGNVFVASGVDGSKPRPLAKTPDVEEEAAINPTGTLVAFRRGTADTARIFTVEPGAAGSATPITDAGFDDGRPAFSPSGETVAFVRSKAGPKDLTRPEDLENLCFVPATGGTPSCKEDDYVVGRPTWSPDGKLVLVLATRPGEDRVELLRYSSGKADSANAADWKDEGYATESLRSPKSNERVVNAAFSPDGKQLAFTANWGKPFVHLFLAPFANGVIGKPKPIPAVRACELSWRPEDGRELVFSKGGSLCEDTTDELARVDPKRPNDQVTLRPQSSNPVWVPAVAGKG